MIDPAFLEELRARYAQRKERMEHFKPPTDCPCGAKFKDKRKDARFCSDACRQRSHRKAVTDKSCLGDVTPFSRDTAPATATATAPAPPPADPEAAG
jgi:hypothetical protein